MPQGALDPQVPSSRAMTTLPIAASRTTDPSRTTFPSAVADPGSTAAAPARSTLQPSAQPPSPTAPASSDTNNNNNGPQVPAHSDSGVNSGKPSSAASVDPPPGPSAQLNPSPPEPTVPASNLPNQLNDPADPKKPKPLNSLLGSSASQLTQSPAINYPPYQPGSITIGSATIPITILPSAAGVIIASQTLRPGGAAITIMDTPISAGHFNVLLVGTSTLTLGTHVTANPSVLAIGKQRYTILAPAPGQQPASFGLAIAVDGTTIQEGGPPITVNGVKVSLGSTALVVGGQTHTFGETPITHTNTAPSVLKIGTQHYTMLTPATDQQFSGIVIAVAVDGITILQGAPAVTVNGVAISLDSTALVIDGHTWAFSPALTTTAALSVLTISTQHYTILTLTPTPVKAQPSGATTTTTAIAVAVHGTTILQDAPAVTVDGVAVSLASTALVVGGKTEVLGGLESTTTMTTTTTTTTAGVDIGWLVWSGIGGTDDGVTGTGTGSQVAVFTGDGGRGRGPRPAGLGRCRLALAVLVVGVWVVVWGI